MTGRGAAAVVFDFDGVLADTERLHLSAFQDALADRGWELDEATYFSRYLGCDDRGLVAALAHDRGLAIGPADIEAIVGVKARRFAARLGAGEALFPGAAACIGRLGARYPLAVASGALSHEIAFVLDAAGLTSRFGAIVGADDVARSKPGPDSYREATRRLAVAPKLAVAVEDSRRGLEAARSAGLRTIAITTSCRAEELSPADAIIDSLDELTAEVVDAVVRGAPLTPPSGRAGIVSRPPPV